MDRIDGMSILRSRTLWVLIAAGTCLRLVLAFVGEGAAFDLRSWAATEAAFSADPLNFYGAVNSPDVLEPLGFRQWPYPPGFVPWLLISAWVDAHLGLAFYGIVQLPAILCDALIALAVGWYLQSRGATDRTCIAAAGLVALGPSFFAISGYHGQIDSVAILPAVLALIAWERADPERRAVYCGLLIGAGALVKWVPLLLVLALLPSGRSRREAVFLMLIPAAMVTFAMAPFYLADPSGVRGAMDYPGVPGFGSLSLFAQPGLFGDPGLAAQFLEGREVEFNGATVFLIEHSELIVLAGLVATGLVLFRVRPGPAGAATVLWLAVFLLLPSFVLQYAVWGLPFFLMAGFVRGVAIAQLALLVPTAIFYSAIDLGQAAAEVYVVIMAGVWLMWIVGLAIVGRRLAASRREVRLGGALA